MTTDATPRSAEPGAAPGAEPTIELDLLDRGHVALRVQGPVATVILNRPQVHNAQLPETWEALAHLGSRLPDDVRVVIVSGEGASFSAGLDRSAFDRTPTALLGRLAVSPAAAADEAIAGFQQAFTWLADPRFVSIAAVSGHAIGAGFQLALACDLIVVAEDAQFRMAEVSLGLVPDLGGTARLARSVGYQRALEICATGRHVGAEEAVRIGLALACVPVDELDAAVADLTAALLESPPDAVRAITALIAGAQVNSPADQLAAERSAQIGLIQAMARSN